MLNLINAGVVMIRFILFFFFSFSSLFATVIIDKEHINYATFPISVYEDITGDMDINDVKKQLFTPYNTSKKSFGYRKESTFWVRIRFQKQQASKKSCAPSSLYQNYIK